MGQLHRRLGLSLDLFDHQAGPLPCHLGQGGDHVLGGDKGDVGVEGSHKGVIEHVFTLICVAGGWWYHGKGAAAQKAWPLSLGHFDHQDQAGPLCVAMEDGGHDVLGGHHDVLVQRGSH